MSIQFGNILPPAFSSAGGSTAPNISSIDFYSMAQSFGGTLSNYLNTNASQNSSNIPLQQEYNQMNAQINTAINNLNSPLTLTQFQNFLISIQNMLTNNGASASEIPSVSLWIDGALNITDYLEQLQTGYNGLTSTEMPQYQSAINQGIQTLLGYFTSTQTPLPTDETSATNFLSALQTTLNSINNSLGGASAPFQLKTSSLTSELSALQSSASVGVVSNSLFNLVSPTPLATSSTSTTPTATQFSNVLPPTFPNVDASTAPNISSIDFYSMAQSFGRTLSNYFNINTEKNFSNIPLRQQYSEVNAQINAAINNLNPPLNVMQFQTFLTSIQNMLTNNGTITSELPSASFWISGALNITDYLVQLQNEYNQLTPAQIPEYQTTINQGIQTLLGYFTSTQMPLPTDQTSATNFLSALQTTLNSINSALGGTSAPFQLQTSVLTSELSALQSSSSPGAISESVFNLISASLPRALIPNPTTSQTTSTPTGPTTSTPTGPTTSTPTGTAISDYSSFADTLLIAAGTLTSNLSCTPPLTAAGFETFLTNFSSTLNQNTSSNSYTITALNLAAEALSQLVTGYTNLSTTNQVSDASSIYSQLSALCQPLETTVPTDEPTLTQFVSSLNTTISKINSSLAAATISITLTPFSGLSDYSSLAQSLLTAFGTLATNVTISSPMSAASFATFLQTLTSDAAAANTAATPNYVASALTMTLQVASQFVSSYTALSTATQVAGESIMKTQMTALISFINANITKASSPISSATALASFMYSLQGSVNSLNTNLQMLGMSVNSVATNIQNQVTTDLTNFNNQCTIVATDSQNVANAQQILTNDTNAGAASTTIMMDQINVSAAITQLNADTATLSNYQKTLATDISNLIPATPSNLSALQQLLTDTASFINLQSQLLQQQAAIGTAEGNLTTAQANLTAYIAANPTATTAASGTTLNTNYVKYENAVTTAKTALFAAQNSSTITVLNGKLSSAQSVLTSTDLPGALSPLFASAPSTTALTSTQLATVNSLQASLTSSTTFPQTTVPGIEALYTLPSTSTVIPSSTIQTITSDFAIATEAQTTLEADIKAFTSGATTSTAQISAESTLLQTALAAVAADVANIPQTPANYLLLQQLTLDLGNLSSLSGAINGSLSQTNIIPILTTLNTLFSENFSAVSSDLQSLGITSPSTTPPPTLPANLSPYTNYLLNQLNIYASILMSSINSGSNFQSYQENTPVYSSILAGLESLQQSILANPPTTITSFTTLENQLSTQINTYNSTLSSSSSAVQLPTIATLTSNMQSGKTTLPSYGSANGSAVSTLVSNIIKNPTLTAIDLQFIPLSLTTTLSVPSTTSLFNTFKTEAAILTNSSSTAAQISTALAALKTALTTFETSVSALPQTQANFVQIQQLNLDITQAFGLLSEMNGQSGPQLSTFCNTLETQFSQIQTDLNGLSTSPTLPTGTTAYTAYLINQLNMYASLIMNDANSTSNFSTYQLNTQGLSAVLSSISTLEQNILSANPSSQSAFITQQNTIASVISSLNTTGLFPSSLPIPTALEGSIQSGSYAFSKTTGAPTNAPSLSSLASAASGVTFSLSNLLSNLNTVYGDLMTIQSMLSAAVSAAGTNSTTEFNVSMFKAMGAVYYAWTSAAGAFTALPSSANNFTQMQLIQTSMVNLTCWAGLICDEDTSSLPIVDGNAIITGFATQFNSLLSELGCSVITTPATTTTAASYSIVLNPSSNILTSVITPNFLINNSNSYTTSLINQINTVANTLSNSLNTYLYKIEQGEKGTFPVTTAIGDQITNVQQALANLVTLEQSITTNPPTTEAEYTTFENSLTSTVTSYNNTSGLASSLQVPLPANLTINLTSNNIPTNSLAANTLCNTLFPLFDPYTSSGYENIQLPY